MKKITMTALAIAIAGCAQQTLDPMDLQTGYQSINQADLAKHIKVIASDKFGGRRPTSEGETLTLEYLTDHFAKLGFEPGNGDSYLQAVDMVEITADENMSLQIGKRELAFKKDMVMTTSRPSELEQLKDSELVFVGYGVNAPEFNWNDYAGVDVKGKTVVVLVNDPGFESGDDSKFNGKTMTYYGRWTYKYEEAARQGAAGVIIVHETKPASYPWRVVENGWSGPQYKLKAAGDMPANVEGWITVDAAKNVFKDAGFDFAALKAKAMQGPIAQPLGLKANVTVKSTVKASTSYNFVATLPGQKNADEHIIYSAHWDHLGTDPKKKGDKIYNGAHDNATGTAGSIEIAEAFSKIKHHDRSVTFLITTAEEQGLLGSKFYAENPIVPISKTVANINMDSLNVLGKVKEVSVVGFGKSEMEDYLAIAAAKQGRTLAEELKPEAGSYYRSDHFNFAKQGIPALYAGGGPTPIDEQTAKYRKRMGLVIKGCYHQPCDQYRKGWDLSGAAQDLQLFFDVGYQLTNSSDWPNWKAGAEFKRQ